MNVKVENWNGHEIRFVEVGSNEWRGVAKDVCDALGLKNSRKAVSSLPDSERGVTTIYTLGGDQTVNVVSELGIYQLVFKSRKKEAIQFQEWVFSVIKTLRQSTGLEGFQIFRMLDKEHQREAMGRLKAGLVKPVKVDFIKANTIANKAVSTVHGYPKMLKKGDMSPDMLVQRQQILDDTVNLMTANASFGLGLSVSKAVYGKYRC